MRGLIILCMLGMLSMPSQSWGQEFDDSKRHRQVGFNMTELISLVIPFKVRSQASGPFGFTWRSGSNGRYFNLQLGARLGSAGSDSDFFNLQLGRLRKRDLNDKWTYYTSQNIIGGSGFFNTPGEEAPNFSDGTIGASFGLGFEYELTPAISLATESLLIIGVAGDGTLRITPPVGIFLLGKF